VADTDLNFLEGDEGGQSQGGGGFSGPGGGTIYNGQVQDPSGAVFGDEMAGGGGYGAAGNALAFPQIQSQAQSGTAPANAATTPSGGTASGLPTASAVLGTAPQPLQAFGGIPQVNPTYADPNQNLGYAQAYQQLMDQSLQPTFQAQDQSEQDQLAARGISSSGAAQDLTNQLYQGQGATVAGANAPIVQQAYGNTQQDITGNVASANNAAATNAGYYNEALTGNANLYNTYEQTLEQQGYNTGNEELVAYLNSFNPSSGVTSAYNTATGGAQGAASNAFSSANAAGGSALGGVAGGLGTYFGDAAEAAAA
jgi:hypothetical protein